MNYLSQFQNPLCLPFFPHRKLINLAIQRHQTADEKTALISDKPRGGDKKHLVTGKLEIAQNSC